MSYNHSEIYSALPTGVLFEIMRVASGFEGGISGVSEVRLLCGGGSSFILLGHRYRIYHTVSAEEMQQTFFRICDGAVYAHRDTVTEGYVSTPGGVRVGVSGTAKYDGGRLVGVSDIGALIFRIPCSKSSLGEELYGAYSSCERGLLVYSRAGVGKTTALRTLVPMIAKREPNENVVVVDERCEFDKDECESLGVAVLRGYDRARGMDIALRTLTAGVIVVDEISSGEKSERISESLLSGVKFVATAHASSLGELLVREGVRTLLDKGVFDVFFGIRYTHTGYSCEIDKKECLKL